MNYPAWALDFFGGGLLIAAIAIFHVYLSHFAVGGGLFLVLTEMRAARTGDERLLDFVYRHSRFFLLVTMVAGGITGVGIWFTIALLSPAATSILIHTFVFAWAVEWVFFVVEIVALFVYYAAFHRMDRRTHLRIGWIYFGAAWMSLFIINGIIDFMLTPGQWTATGDFWDGFFNPTFWPALAFRSLFAILIAGLFGLFTATWIDDRATRIGFTRYSALWLLLPFLLFLASAWWYRAALPPALEQHIFSGMPDLAVYIKAFLLLSPLLVLGGLILAIRLPAGISRSIASIMLILGLLYMGCFEFIREGGRHPYLIRDYMYSTSILESDLPSLQAKGIIGQAKWIANTSVADDNRLEVGRELFTTLCLPCHSIGGPLNDILPVTATYDPEGLDAMISGIDALHPSMPPFPGTPAERGAIASYIATGLHGKIAAGTPQPLPGKEVYIPDFDSVTDEYILLAWSALGMNSSPDARGLWQPAAGSGIIQAQLIRRGELPEVVSDDVSLVCIVETGFHEASGSSGPWPMTATGGVFSSAPIAIRPYPAEGGFDPQPVFTIEARQGETVLAATRVVLPASTAVGCRTCHGGSWTNDGRAGISSETVTNILTIHDQRSGTALLGSLIAGAPTGCRTCHAETANDGKHSTQQLSLSASIHGFHANYLRNRGADACVLCHPDGQRASTSYVRGVHQQFGMDCTNCHGPMEDFSLSLLKEESAQGKAQAERLMAALEPRLFDSQEAILPRSPWINQPDCLHCHLEFQAPEGDQTFNAWTEDGEALYRNRTEMSGQIHCAACHGSPHATYPADSGRSETLDNIQPLQYQQNTLPIGADLNCAVCHTVDMEDEMHHPNMLRNYRNQ